MQINRRLYFVFCILFAIFAFDFLLNATRRAAHLFFGQLNHRLRVVILRQQAMTRQIQRCTLLNGHSCSCAPAKSASDPTAPEVTSVTYHRFHAIFDVSFLLFPKHLLAPSALLVWTTARHGCMQVSHQTAAI
jgi:hypothetical protein